MRMQSDSVRPKSSAVLATRQPANRPTRPADAELRACEEVLYLRYFATNEGNFPIENDSREVAGQLWFDPVQN